MTELQALYLDYAITGLFWGVWLGMISLALDKVLDMLKHD